MLQKPKRTEADANGTAPGLLNGNTKLAPPDVSAAIAGTEAALARQVIAKELELRKKREERAARLARKAEVRGSSCGCGGW